jgi:hypothetical protein
MKDLQSKLFPWCVGTILVFAIGNLHAAESYSSQITASAEYSANSRQGVQVQQWLLQQGAPSAPGLNTRFSSGDRLKVTRTTAARPDNVVATASPGDGPPVPLPTNGNPGDRISVTHESGGYVQTWTYQWFGSSTNGGWGLIKYTYERVRVGPAPG